MRASLRSSPITFRQTGSLCSRRDSNESRGRTAQFLDIVPQLGGGLRGAAMGGLQVRAENRWTRACQPRALQSPNLEAGSVTWAVLGWVPCSSGPLGSLVCLQQAPFHPVLSLQSAHMAGSSPSVFRIGPISVGQPCFHLAFGELTPSPPRPGPELRAQHRPPELLLRCSIQAGLLLHQLVPVPGG